MSKVTIIGATGNVGMFAAYAISADPHVHEIQLYGREGREEREEKQEAGGPEGGGGDNNEGNASYGNV